MTNYLIGLIYRKSVPYVTKIQILAILSLELVFMALIILVSTNSDKNTSNKKNPHPHPIKGAVGRGVNIEKIHLFTS